METEERFDDVASVEAIENDSFEELVRRAHIALEQPPGSNPSWGKAGGHVITHCECVVNEWQESIIPADVQMSGLAAPSVCRSMLEQ